MQRLFRFNISNKIFSISNSRTRDLILLRVKEFRYYWSSGVHFIFSLLRLYIYIFLATNSWVLLKLVKVVCQTKNTTKKSNTKCDVVYLDILSYGSIIDPCTQIYEYFVYNFEVDAFITLLFVTWHFFLAMILINTSLWVGK